MKENLKQLAIHKINFKLLFFITKYLFCKFLHPLVIQFTFFWQIRIQALKIIPVSQVKLFNLPFDIIYECIHRSWWKYGTELLNFLNVMCLVSNHIFSHQGTM